MSDLCILGPSQSRRDPGCNEHCLPEAFLAFHHLLWRCVSHEGLYLPTCPWLALASGTLLRSGSFRSGRDLQSEHEGKRCKRSDSLDLVQELGFWVMLFRDGFQLPIVFADTLRKRAARFQDGSKDWPERIGDVLRRFVVESHRWAFGQPATKGLDCSSNVVYKLCAGTPQRLTRADDGHMGLGVFAPMLEWVQELRVKTYQASQIPKASIRSVLGLL
jgi:hypothetical protein